MGQKIWPFALHTLPLRPYPSVAVTIPYITLPYLSSDYNITAPSPPPTKHPRQLQLFKITISSLGLNSSFRFLPRIHNLPPLPSLPLPPLNRYHYHYRYHCYHYRYHYHYHYHYKPSASLRATRTRMYSCINQPRGCRGRVNTFGGRCDSCRVSFLRSSSLPPSSSLHPFLLSLPLPCSLPRDCRKSLN